MTEAKRPPGVDEGRTLSDYCLAACDADCCRKIGFVVKPNDLMRGLLQAHYGTDIEQVRFTLRHDCPHLDGNVCTLWDKDEEKDARPEFCRNFLCGRAREKRIELDAFDDVEIELG
jgi:hypothetical protein